MFLSKNTHKTHNIVKVAVINDNNNFAPSIFRSLCEFVSDCFGPRYFSSGAALPQKNTLVQNNHLRIHTMTSKKMVRSYYCLISKKTRVIFIELFSRHEFKCKVTCRTIFVIFLLSGWLTTHKLITESCNIGQLALTFIFEVITTKRLSYYSGIFLFLSVH